MSKKETTIDDLAIMVKHGFDGVEKKFDGVDKEFKNIDKQFTEVYKRFDNIETRLNRIEKGLIANHERRIEKLEDEIVDIKGLLAIQ